MDPKYQILGWLAATMLFLVGFTACGTITAPNRPEAAVKSTVSSPSSASAVDDSSRPSRSSTFEDPQNTPDPGAKHTPQTAFPTIPATAVDGSRMATSGGPPEEGDFPNASDEKLVDTIDLNYSGLKELDKCDLSHFQQRIQEQLPKYRNYFEEAGKKHGFDWRLLAALSYQESKWNPNAVSFAGASGIMMITPGTAKTLSLKDPLEARGSISAASRYLAKLHKMIGDTVPEPDRTLMALASFNIGPGHLQDARKLAEDLNQQADSWQGVRSVLPLLQEQQYHALLPKGYARGSETVLHVDRVVVYYKVLDAVLEENLASK